MKVLKLNKFLNNTTCVILCGGKGSRLLPLSLKKSKSIIEINNKTILDHVIDYWKNFTNNFVFVIKYRKEQIMDHIKKLDINAKFVEPEEFRGIADGLLYAKDFVSEKFIVVLGDCIIQGKFKFPENIEQGFGIHKTNEENHIKCSYSVELGEEYVSKVVEKPIEIINDLCGMGCYFFNKKIFDYIEKTPVEQRGITEIIQIMIDNGEKIHPVFFDGNYININTLKDLERAKDLFK